VTVNKIIFQRAAFLISLTAIASVSNGLSARAETTETDIAGASTQLVVSQPSDSLNTQSLVDLNTQFVSDATPTQIPELEPLNPTALEAIPQEVKNQPIPGTAETSASALLQQPVTTPSSETTAKLDSPTVAQAELEPGRATRSGSSYIGIGGNIGIGGETALGDFGFTVFSKIGLSRRFSVRPAVVFSGDTDILLPLTFDFPIQAEPFERINLAPYAGAGVIITTNSDSNIGLLLSGGVDLPISEQFTATAGLNLGFNTDTVGVGIILGIGYNFGAGFRF
jgi:hypothetical protein